MKKALLTLFTILFLTVLTVGTAVSVSAEEPVNLDSYHSNYGYTELGNQSNGVAKQSLYQEIDLIANQFHSNTALNASEGNVVGSFQFASLGLTDSEAIEVWEQYKNDHPLYYWISTSVQFTDSHLFLLTDAEYAKGSDRAIFNQIIYDGISEYMKIIEGESSSYQIALAFHDTIISEIDYAYESDGVTPEDAAWAHNILGVFEKQSGVCEAYARTFQLLLNYCEIDNVLALGVSREENHAWNLAKMDDGNWYWFDLTWDDTPKWLWGISYNYFCVNDTQNCDKSDFGWNVENFENFLQSHTPKSTSLPTRSGVTFDSDDLLLRESFSVDDWKYLLVGYKTVQLYHITGEGYAEISEYISYQGKEYKIISLGQSFDGILDSGSIVEASITSLHIPKTVIFISDYALGGVGLQVISVDSENPKFTAKDGVLFTKSLYTLIQYPSGNARLEYVIPDETFEIAHSAFRAQLNKLTIGKAVIAFGRNNWGSGYPDGKNFWDGVMFDTSGYTSGDLYNTFHSMVGEKEIIISPENQTYRLINGVIYVENKLELVVDSNITSITIPKDIHHIDAISTGFTVLSVLENLEAIYVEEGNPFLKAIDGILYRITYYDSGAQAIEIETVPKKISGIVSIANGVTTIEAYAFMDCINLTGITIPNGVTSIGDYSFNGCTNLEKIEIPNSVTSLGWSVFENCTNLIRITIPESVTSIGGYAFAGCTNLTHTTLPTYIVRFNMMNAFENCSSLEAIVLPIGVTTIESYAFYNCTSLTRLIIPNTVTNIGTFAFAGCEDLTTLVYCGISQEWEAISKGSGWDDFSGISTVIYHDYPEGKDKCTLCGHYRDGIASLYGYSISLNGDISINFYFDVTEETRNDAGAYILITYPNGSTEKILLSEARTKTAGNVTYYIVNPALPAKEINSIISARVVLSDGTVGILYEKSIRGYAETVIANAASFTQEQVALMEALIAYGEAASIHFGGESAEHQMTEITAETLKAYEIQKSGSTNAGLSYYGSSVLLESETTIRHYFKLTSGDITDHTFLLDGEAVTPVNEAGTNYWYIDIPNIVSKDLDRVYVLEADGMTIEYNALSYAYAALNAYGNDAAKGAMCNTVRALYEYNLAANAYFEK